MKSTVKFHGRARRTARHLQELIAIALSSAIAVRYCLAARQDEKNGFPFTAAMEWRKAAELFAPIPLMSCRCWHEWERIMHLPRHLADPVGVFNAAQDSSPTPHIEAVTVTVPNELPLVAAA